MPNNCINRSARREFGIVPAVAGGAPLQTGAPAFDETHPLPRHRGVVRDCCPPARRRRYNFFQRKNELAFSRVTSAVPTSMRFSTGCPRAALMASSMLRLPITSGY